MTYYVNTATNAVTAGLYDGPHQASGWVTKTEGEDSVQICFHNNGVPALLPGGVPVLLGIKAYQQFSEGYLTSVTGFTAPQTAGQFNFYTAQLLNNTAPINTALGSTDGGNTPGDVPSIPQTTCEIQWWLNGNTNPPTKSLTFSVEIDNTPNRGNETAPGSSTPYPAPAAVATALLVPTAIKTAGGYNAVAQDLIPADLTSGNLAVTLPTAPTDGTRVGLKIIKLANSNNCSVQPGAGDALNTSTGGPSFLSLVLLNQGIILQYSAASHVWYVVSDDVPLSQLDLRYEPGLGAPESNGSLLMSTVGKLRTWLPTTAFGQGLLDVANATGLLTLLGFAGRYSVELYGAVGDGVTDDTAAIQAAITAAEAVHGVVCLAPRTYCITAPLVISDAVTVKGAGMQTLYGSLANSARSNFLPTQAPYLTGSVLLQTTAATNAINIPVAGKAVNLRHLGIRFADGIKWTNTGHGIYANPPALGGVQDNGIEDASWENVTVYGVDGNHYGYYLINPLLCCFTHIRSYGGGGLYSDTFGTTANNQYYGNTTLVDPYFYTCVNGSARPLWIKSSTDFSFQWTFIRLQTFVDDVSGIAGLGMAAPSTSQVPTIDAATQNVTLISPDLESTVTGANPSIPSSIVGLFITPGISNDTTQAGATHPFVCSAPSALSGVYVAGQTAAQYAFNPPAAGIQMRYITDAAIGTFAGGTGTGVGVFQFYDFAGAAWHDAWIRANGYAFDAGGVRALNLGVNGATFYSNNNTFAPTVVAQNQSTGTQALGGFKVLDSSGADAAQMLFVPANYVLPSLQNTALFSSVGNRQIGFVADATLATTPDIYFQSGGQPAAMTVTGATNKVTIRKLNLSNLPTTAAGLSSGDVWNNAGVLTIV